MSITGHQYKTCCLFLLFFFSMGEYTHGCATFMLKAMICLHRSQWGCITATTSWTSGPQSWALVTQQPPPWSSNFGSAVLLQGQLKLHLGFLVSDSLRRLGKQEGDEEIHNIASRASPVSPVGWRMMRVGGRLQEGKGRPWRPEVQALWKHAL